MKKCGDIKVICQCSKLVTSRVFKMACFLSINSGLHVFVQSNHGDSGSAIMCSWSTRHACIFHGYVFGLMLEQGQQLLFPIF